MSVCQAACVHDPGHDLMGSHVCVGGRESEVAAGEGQSSGAIDQDERERIPVGVCHRDFESGHDTGHLA